MEEGACSCDVAVRLGAAALTLTLAAIQSACAALEKLEKVRRRVGSETVFWRFSSDTRGRDRVGGSGNLG